MNATWHALGALQEQGATTIYQPCLTCSCNLSQLFVGEFWACSYVFYQQFFFCEDLLSYFVHTNSFNEFFFAYNIRNQNMQLRF